MKTRASTVAGLLENYTVIDDVIKSSQEASGSATKENERYLDSIDGKLAQLTNRVQEFWSAVLKSGIVKFVIDSLSSILSIITDIVKFGDGIPALLATMGIAANRISKGSSGGRIKNYSNKKIN